MNDDGVDLNDVDKTPVDWRGTECHMERMTRAGLVFDFILVVLTSTVVVGALIFWMFSLGGVFTVAGWVLVVLLVIWDWSILRQTVKLTRGDVSHGRPTPM